MAKRTPAAEQPLTETDTTTPWPRARARLETPEQNRTYWLATARPDGRPHVVPVLGLWLHDAFYFLTGEMTRRGRHLAANPQCVMTVSSQTLPALDLIVEGDCHQVRDAATLRRVVDAYGETMQWPLEVRDGAVSGPSAPTAGPPPYGVFALTPRTVIGVPGIAGTEQGVGKAGSFHPTRWRF
jgi:hypothetical protein